MLLNNYNSMRCHLSEITVDKNTVPQYGSGLWTNVGFCFNRCNYKCNKIRQNRQEIYCVEKTLQKII